MAQIVTNIIQNSLSGMVAGAVTTVGGYAGDAVGSVGNLIEAKGQAVGNNIAKKFEGYGSGFTAYGNSVRSATAPNAGYSSAPTRKAPSTTAKKVGTTAKKPPTSPVKKALPSIPERKLLTAPPTKSVQEKGPAQGTYSKSVEPYKNSAAAKKSTYAASNAAVSTVTTKTNRTLKPTGNAKLNQAQKNLSPIKSATNAAGKVVIDKKSLPSKAKAPSVVGNTSGNESYKGPLNLGGIASGKPKNESKPSAGYQAPKTGYQGPLNLGGVAAASGPKSTVNGAKEAAKPAVSKAPSVVGGAGKPGGYGGPLDLGGLA